MHDYNNCVYLHDYYNNCANLHNFRQADVEEIWGILGLNIQIYWCECF